MTNFAFGKWINVNFFPSKHFQIESDFVRLGEYNTDTTDDGKHIDIAIDRLEKHRDYTKVPKINDIVVITLVHDVEFTGKLKSFFSFNKCEFIIIFLQFTPLYRSH